MIVDDIIDYLICPDCRYDLKKYNSVLTCTQCGRRYKVYSDICLDLMPSKKFKRQCKANIEKKSNDIYNKLFDEDFMWKERPMPWGINVPKNYVKKLEKHKHMLYKLIPEKGGKFIDISVGSGRFSLELIERFDITVLCDISVDAVVCISDKILKEKRRNVLVVRCDYFSLPFKEFFDLCICTDTLIYGPEHEREVLSSIYKILHGVAILDFSNKYHRGFWHKPYTYGYSYQKMVQLLWEAGFVVEESIPLYYELSKDLDEKKLLSKIMKFFLPPTRYIFKVRKKYESSIYS